MGDPEKSERGDPNQMTQIEGREGQKRKDRRPEKAEPVE